MDERTGRGRLLGALLIAATLSARAGARGRLRLTAKGGNLDLPELDALTLPIRVQLRSNTGACWETSFSDQGVEVHEAVIFRATSD
jgi:hypothetical protein